MANPGQDGYDSAAVRRVYQGMAADYSDRFGADLACPDSDTAFLDAALADLPDGPVLDVGCGPAQVSRYLLGLRRLPIGVDFAPDMLAAAARLVPQASLVAADLLDLPFRPASCAGAVASYSLHHLPGARLDAALAGLRAALRPRGVLVVITHGGSGEERLGQYDGNVVLCRHSAADLAARLARIGLEIELASERPPRPGEFPADKVRVSARAPA
ncbi:MAG TPA: class I SAM-dependent methyltransferase [Streptosporangiaceae bacterium]|nr:class I SAM-dependent methyltransferase [Streptosporangiaceae bacterium]